MIKRCWCGGGAARSSFLVGVYGVWCSVFFEWLLKFRRLLGLLGSLFVDELVVRAVVFY